MVDMKPNFEDVFSSRVRVRILRFIFKQMKGTIAAWLVKDCHSDSKTIQEHLDFLVRCGFLVSQECGRVKIYRARLDNPLVRGIKKLFEFWEDGMDLPEKTGLGVRSMAGLEQIGCTGKYELEKDPCIKCELQHKCRIKTNSLVTG